MRQDYVGKEAARAPSPDLWKHVDEEGLRPGDALTNLYEDFTVLPVTDENCVIDEDDDKGDVNWIETEIGGMLRVEIGTAGDDDEEAWIRSILPICNIGSGKGKMCFEMAFRTSTIVDDYNGILMGLVGAVTAGADKMQIVATGLLATAAAGICFGTKMDAAGETLLAQYAEAATATTTLGTMGTLVAAQFHTVGLYFDGRKKVTYYFDGAPVQSVLYSADNFPDAVDLYWFSSVKVGSTAGLVDLDTAWIKCIQLHA